MPNTLNGYIPVFAIIGLIALAFLGFYFLERWLSDKRKKEQTVYLIKDAKKAAQNPIDKRESKVTKVFLRDLSAGLALKNGLSEEEVCKKYGYSTISYLRRRVKLREPEIEVAWLNRYDLALDTNSNKQAYEQEHPDVD